MPVICLVKYFYVLIDDLKTAANRNAWHHSSLATVTMERSCSRSQTTMLLHCCMHPITRTVTWMTMTPPLITWTAHSFRLIHYSMDN